jgi:hypothetical protein
MSEVVLVLEKVYDKKSTFKQSDDKMSDVKMSEDVR